MRIKGYIALAVGTLTTVLLIVAIASGWFRNDLSIPDPIVWVATSPMLIAVIVWHRLMKTAALAELELAQRVPGQPAHLTDEFVARWTGRGAAFGAGSFLMALLIIMAASSVPPRGSEQLGAVAVVALFGAGCFALSAAYRAQRAIRSLESEIVDESP